MYQEIWGRFYTGVWRGKWGRKEVHIRTHGYDHDIHSSEISDTNKLGLQTGDKNPFWSS